MFKPAFVAVLAITCSLFSSSELFSPAPMNASPADRAKVDQDDLTPEEELALARNAVLSGRPYKLDYSLVGEVFVLNVLPSSVVSQVYPDWWSEKQGYDLARLYAIALRKYPAFKVVSPPTWDEKSLSDEQRLSGSGEGSGAGQNSVNTRKSAKKTYMLGNKEYDIQFNVSDYSFQYLPVKRRGIGFGFIALNTKECSTETYFKSEISIDSSDVVTGPPLADSDKVFSGFGAAGDQKLSIDRLIIDKTGGASLNLNFLVGGAGGGNFTPPDKPLKKVLYQSVVDGAEAAFCLLTGQKECIDYYKSRSSQAPTVLTSKQKKKVGGC